jgi:CRP/FNR family cyclic AMP-dependent transcriptional regulator
MISNIEERYHSYRIQELCKLGISNSTARQIENKLNICSYESEQIIWRRGSPVQSWHLIISGLVSASISTDRRNSVPLFFYGPGAWYGELSIINGKNSFADYTTISSVDILVMPKELVLDLLEKEAGFTKYITRLTSWRLQSTSEVLTIMKLGNPILRVTMGLSQVGEALAYKSDRPPTIGFGDGVSIPTKQQVLASLCGVSRTVFSDVISNLAKSGYLKITYGGLELLMPDVWHQYNKLQREKEISELNPTYEQVLREFSLCEELSGQQL